VALLDGDVLLGQYMLDVRVTHSERLMGAVDRLLGDARWTVRDLTALAVAVGPGSFTGLRVGLSTVKGLALALGIPVAAVPTLDAMAASLPFAALPVCPVRDARKGEVHASLYRCGGVLYEMQQNRVGRCWVGGEDGGVVGYLCVWEVADELHITNIAVHPAFRRRGMARTLLGGVLDDARQRRLRLVVLEVRPSNAE